MTGQDACDVFTKNLRFVLFDGFSEKSEKSRTNSCVAVYNTMLNYNFYFALRIKLFKGHLRKQILT